MRQEFILDGATIGYHIGMAENPKETHVDVEKACEIPDRQQAKLGTEPGTLNL